MCFSIFLKNVPSNYRPHYIEYLCGLIRSNNLETNSILTADDLETVVRRASKKLPPKPYGILEGIYRHALLEVIINFTNTNFLSLFLPISI